MVMGGLLVILSKSEKLGRGGGRSGGGGGLFSMLLKQLPNMVNDELPLWSFYQK